MSKKRLIARERSVALGLDVDSKASALVVLDVTTGEILYESHISHSREDWLRFLQRLHQCRIWACYETGGIGFHLCRMLRSLGVDCKVVPVSKIPKAPESRQQKTDRRDALSLAQLYFHAPKSFVRIPTEAEEADRQIIRTRYQLMKDRVRTMLRIKAFLLFHNIQRPAGSKTDWSISYRRWLKSRPCPYQELNDCLQIYVDELDNLEALLHRLKEKILALSRTDRYRQACDRLTSQIPGVGPLTAMTFLCEIFRPEDFPTAEAMAAHVGLTPCEYSSGKRHRYGHITHWGPPHLRKLLVEAAWAWVRKDEQARERYQSIRAGSKGKIAIIGMARRLAIIMWAMTVKEQDYQYRWAA
jgi:transposase